MAGARASWQAMCTAALQDSRISMILTDDTEECKAGLRGMARQCDWVVHLRRGDVRPFLECLAETRQQVHAGIIASMCAIVPIQWYTTVRQKLCRSLPRVMGLEDLDAETELQVMIQNQLAQAIADLSRLLHAYGRPVQVMAECTSWFWLLDPVRQLIEDKLFTVEHIPDYSVHSVDGGGMVMYSWCRDRA